MTVIPEALNGAVIPGGCGTCNAEQRLTQEQPGLWTLGIAHDDWCPTWRQIQARRARHPPRPSAPERNPRNPRAA